MEYSTSQAVSFGTILLLALWGQKPSVTLWTLKHCWEHHVHIHQDAQIQVKNLNKLDIIWGRNLDTYYDLSLMEDLIVNELLVLMSELLGTEQWF